MKKSIIAVLLAAMCFCFVACKDEAPTPKTEPAAEPVSESGSIKRDLEDSEIETLLNFVFDIDGFQTVSTVSDGKASVYLFSADMDDAFVQASTGDEAAVEMWGELVAIWLNMHNSATEFLDQCSIETHETVVCGKKFPYISIVNGEVEMDFLSFGQ